MDIKEYFFFCWGGGGGHYIMTNLYEIVAVLLETVKMIK